MEKNQNNESNNKSRPGTRKVTPDRLIAADKVAKFIADKNFDRFDAINILKRI